LKYTPDIPKLPGFYWCRRWASVDEVEEQVVQVLHNPYTQTKKLCVFVPGWECPESPDDYAFEWCGPLLKPDGT